MRKKIKDLHIYLNPEKKAHAEVLRKIEVYQEMFGVSVRDAIIALLLYSSISVVPTEFESKQLIGNVSVPKPQVPSKAPEESSNLVEEKAESELITPDKIEEKEAPVLSSVEEASEDKKDYLDMTTDEQLRSILLNKYSH